MAFVALSATSTSSWTWLTGTSSRISTVGKTTFCGEARYPQTPRQRGEMPPKFLPGPVCFSLSRGLWRLMDFQTFAGGSFWLLGWRGRSSVARRCVRPSSWLCLPCPSFSNLFRNICESKTPVCDKLDVSHDLVRARLGCRDPGGCQPRRVRGRRGSLREFDNIATLSPDLRSSFRMSRLSCFGRSRFSRCWPAPTRTR